MSKYIAEIEAEDFTVQVDRSGSVTLNGETRDAHLEDIDGEALYSLLLDNRTYEVFVQVNNGAFYVTVEGQRFEVKVAGERQTRASDQPARRQQVQSIQAVEPLTSSSGLKTLTGSVTSPMTGVLIEILVGEGQEVEAGDGVAILEAMKTENVIRAPRSGTVGKVKAALGETLRMDDVIMYIKVQGS